MNPKKRRMPSVGDGNAGEAPILPQESKWTHVSCPEAPQNYICRLTFNEQD